MIEYHRINEKISQKVTPERVEARLELIGAFADELLADTAGLNDGVFLNPSILTSMVRSYFIDVERYKDFHVIGYIESYKVASYSAKWILRYKPIQFKVDEPDQLVNPLMHQLNELLALQWGFAVADIDLDTVDDTDFANLLYTLHYRSFSEDYMTLVLKAMGGSEAGLSG